MQSALAWSNQTNPSSTTDSLALVPDVVPAKYTCEVVVQPFLRFTTGIADAFNNASIPSAHGVPTHRRTLMTLTVQNKLPADIKPPWNLTIRAPRFNSYVTSYNARFMGYDVTTLKATFQVYQPYLTLKRSEDNNISVMIVADNKVWTTEERIRRSLAPEYAAVNGHPCKIYSSVHPALKPIPTSTAAPGAVLIHESTTSAAPLSVLLPRRAAATEATLGSSTDAERPPESASTEQSQIVNTFPSGLLPSGSPKAVAGIRALNGVLYGANGKPVVLQGANWFGFETSATMVGGLWAGSTSLTQDFATVVWRLKLLGFNAVRLPFSFQVLLQFSAAYLANYCSPAGTAAIQQNVVAPGYTAPSAQPPRLAHGSPITSSSVCNSAIPNPDVYGRFLSVVRFLTANGFYVLLDNQFNMDTTAKDNPGQWIAWWKQVLTDVIRDPASKARVMVDLLNEPDSHSLGWEAVGPLYLKAMDVLYRVSPTTLFFIQGSGQTNCGQNYCAMCWGDGFITDPELIAQSGMSDPRPFFVSLLSRPYLNNVVISPHYYPPSISHATSQYTSYALWNRMSTSFGYLNKFGYGGHKFPIVIGESGSYYTDYNDIQMLADMALYLRNQGAAADGRHNPIPHMFWWAWNENSGDTGGLVSSPNWDSILWYKINYMISTIRLAPWYISRVSTEEYEPQVSIEDARVADEAARVADEQARVYKEEYLAPTRQGNCSVGMSLGSEWKTAVSLLHMSTLKLTLKNWDGEDLVPPYPLQLYSPNFQYAAAPLNWAPTWMGRGAINGIVNAGYGMLKADGGSYLSINILVGGQDATLLPEKVLLNSTECRLYNIWT